MSNASDYYRNNNLWTGRRIILPKHRDMMHETDATKKKLEPPDLDEDRIAILEARVKTSLERGSPLLIEYVDCSGRCQTVKSLVTAVRNGVIVAGDLKIKFSWIVDIKE